MSQTNHMKWAMYEIEINLKQPYKPLPTYEDQIVRLVPKDGLSTLQPAYELLGKNMAGHLQKEC